MADATNSTHGAAELEANPIVCLECNKSAGLCIAIRAIWPHLQSRKTLEFQALILLMILAPLERDKTWALVKTLTLKLSHRLQMDENRSRGLSKARLTSR